MTKKSRKKLKYLEKEKSFWAEIKSIFHHFWRAINCQKLSQTWECAFHFIKNRDIGTDVSYELCEISHNAFLKKPFGRLLLHNHSFWNCPTTTFRLFKNDVTPVFRLSTFSTEFEDWEQEWAQYVKTLGKKPIFNLFKHLWWSFFAKIVNSFKLTLQGAVKWKAKTWEICITLANFAHWP